MRVKFCSICCAVFCLLMVQNAVASLVLNETGTIFGVSGEEYSFVADEDPLVLGDPLVYAVTLTDFEFPAPFDFLGVAITTSTESIATLLSPGTTTFTADFDTTYFANVIGSAGGSIGVGLFNISIAQVPVPPSLLIFGSGLIGMILLWRRKMSVADDP